MEKRLEVSDQKANLVRELLIKKKHLLKTNALECFKHFELKNLLYEPVFLQITTKCTIFCMQTAGPRQIILRKLT
jgi:hypothetical protein